MFNVGMTGFGHNGFTNMIQTSSYSVDKVIDDFENAIAAGLDPNDVKQDIFNKNGVREADIIEPDRTRLIKKIEAMYEYYNSRGDR